MKWLLGSWIGSFLITQVVEAPIYAIALRRDQGAAASSPPALSDSPISGGAPAMRARVATFAARSWPAALAIGAIPSALTHPLVWFAIPRLVFEPWLLFVLVAEGFAIVSEALLLRWIGVRDALLWAILANASSVAVGQFARMMLS